MSKVTSKKTLTPSKNSNILRKSSNSSPTRCVSKSSSRNLSISKANPVIETKLSDKPSQLDISSLQTLHRLTPKVLVTDLLSGNLLSESSMDFTSLHYYDLSQGKEALQETFRQEQDELTTLKLELSRKNALIEHLRSENISLRKEIEDFVCLADKIQSKFQEDLKKFEIKISALEQENSDLLAENRFYKEQTHRRFMHRSSADNIFSVEALILNEKPENYKEKPVCDTKEYNSQAPIKTVTFQTPKDKSLKSLKNSQIENYDFKENAPKTCRNSKEEERTPKKVLSSKRDQTKMLVSPPLKKLKSPPQSARSSMSALPKRIVKEPESKTSLDLTLDKRLNTPM